MYFNNSGVKLEGMSSLIRPHHKVLSPMSPLHTNVLSPPRHWNSGFRLAGSSKQPPPKPKINICVVLYNFTFTSFFMAACLWRTSSLTTHSLKGIKYSLKHFKAFLWVFVQPDGPGFYFYKLGGEGHKLSKEEKSLLKSEKGLKWWKLGKQDKYWARNNKQYK